MTQQLHFDFLPESGKTTRSTWFEVTAISLLTENIDLNKKF